MAQQQHPYYGTFYQQNGTYLPPQGQQMAGAPQGQPMTGAPQGQPMTGAQQQQMVAAQQSIQQGMLPLEQSYIENILRLNKGKQATVVMTYERNSALGTQYYTGIIEAAGRDHIVISDPKTGKRFLLLMIYLDYVEFPEEITYLPGQQAATYPPRL